MLREDGFYDKKGIKESFSSIASRYDLLNTLLSWGIDRSWRTRALRHLELRAGGRYLDLCAGTLGLGKLLFRREALPTTFVFYDFCMEMLIKGRRDCSTYLKYNHFEVINGDGEQISFRAESYDGAIACFGIRNLVNLDRGLEEVARILKPGAKFVVLEFSNSTHPLIRPFYNLYLEKVVPWVGGLLTGNRGAYNYLASSIASFLHPEELAQRLVGAGFKGVYYFPLTWGIAYIHAGSKG